MLRGNDNIEYANSIIFIFLHGINYTMAHNMKLANLRVLKLLEIDETLLSCWDKSWLHFYALFSFYFDNVEYTGTFCMKFINNCTMCDIKRTQSQPPFDVRCILKLNLEEGHTFRRIDLILTVNHLRKLWFQHLKCTSCLVTKVWQGNENRLGHRTESVKECFHSTLVRL